MFFLKKIEIFGFKSFANPIIINFDIEHKIIGIVGPNGSGKSNINDAIRWCLGEHSIKLLRGNNSKDIIFNGSETKQALNISEVKLIFDNTKRIFKIDYDEIEIIRRIFRETGENEYFINKKRVNLKDIQNFAMDSGLTKSSLALISQGNINSFIESKPLDRRQLFEETAGIAKYKRYKLESIKKLNCSNENLTRLKDILNEIKRKLPNLKQQNIKALKYTILKNKLNIIQLSIVVKDITFFNKKKSELYLKQKININNKKNANQELKNKENEFNELNKENYNLDIKINILNKKFQNLILEISNLKIIKINLDNKNKHLKISNNDIEISNMINNFHELTINLQNEHKKLKILEMQQKKDKIKWENFNKKQIILNKKLEIINKNIIRLDSELEYIKYNIKNKNNLHEGVKNIIDNKNVLPGIIGIVKDIITIDEKYEKAIITILNSYLQNILVENINDTKLAISYLKKNNAGRATFIPLDIIFPRYINDDEKFIIKSIPGYLGLANNFVKTKKKFNIVIDYLLSCYIICIDIISAQKIGKLINYNYNIVTLDGEIIHSQGAISGGTLNTNIKIINSKKEIKIINEKITIKNKEYDITLKKLNILHRELYKVNEIIIQNQTSIGAEKQKIEIILQNKDNIKNEYQLLTSKNIDKTKIIKNKKIINITEQIRKKELLKIRINQQLNVFWNLKNKQLLNCKELNNKINKERHFILKLQEQINKINSDLLIINVKIQQNLTILTEEYNMTYDNAKTLKLKKINNENLIRNEIKEIRNELKQIGNVNLEAITEYKKENTRFKFMKNQYNDINNAIKNLLYSINKMDNIMKKKFSKTIKEINEILPSIFKILFSRGSAKIIYTEPKDLLKTGLDIKIYIPGKNITNLNLLSGGEKTLVTLSILFAILKIHPIPLVILDEVEASLDLVNVERFSKYIKSFIEITQFIIVTHRIETMKYCDILYGVTMQQKGISKIVGIKLQQATKMIKKI